MLTTIYQVYETGTAITSSGALTAYSGKKTGRSPLDKRIVKEESSEKDIWYVNPCVFPLVPSQSPFSAKFSVSDMVNRWGPVNKPMTPEVSHFSLGMLTLFSIPCRGREPIIAESHTHTHTHTHTHAATQLPNCRQSFPEYDHAWANITRLGYSLACCYFFISLLAVGPSSQSLSLCIALVMQSRVLLRDPGRWRHSCNPSIPNSPPAVPITELKPPAHFASPHPTLVT